MQNYILIIGLGNPGKKYQLHRHNAGKKFILAFHQKQNFTPWKNFKNQAEISLGKINDQKIILAQPLLFMNKSGQVIHSLRKFFQVPLKKMIIVQDDTDIYLGKYKIHYNRSAAGHKGVISIIQSCRSAKFWRLRIGIRPSRFLNKAEDLVLQNFSSKERKILENLFKEKLFAEITKLIKSLKGKPTNQ